MPSGILATGAGAAQGLETLLSRLMAEEQMARRNTESDRDFGQHQAEFGAEQDYRNRSLDENMKLRMIQQESLDQSRGESARARDESNVMRRINLRPVGSTVTPEEYRSEIALGVPKAVYGEKYVGMSGDDASEPINEITFTGTQPQLNDAERIQAQMDRDKANIERDSANRALAEERERRLAANPPTVMIQSPDGYTTYAPRGAAIGMEAPNTASTRDKIKAYENTLQLIGELEGAVESAGGWKGIGPITGTVGAGIYRYAGGTFPTAGGGPEGEIIRTKVNNLRAQASFQEGGKQFTGTEKELLDSFLATVSQDPVVAAARLEEFKRRALITLGTMRSTHAPDPNAPAPADDVEYDWVPGQGVVPRGAR